MEQAERIDRLKAALVDGALFAVLFFVSRIPVVGLIASLALLGLTGYQWWLLTKQGQTIGKQFFKIKIVKVDSLENGGFVTNVLLRSIVNGVLMLLPFYFLIDALLIFRQDRRCVHDFLAGTQVVKAYA